MNKANTFRDRVLKGLTAAHWDDYSHYVIERRTFTDRRIVPTSGNKAIPKTQKHWLSSWSRACVRYPKPILITKSPWLFADILLRPERLHVSFVKGRIRP